MGSWGVGPFDNDDAGDWVFELQEASDLDLVRRTICAALEVDDYLELSEGNRAVAAAAVIAASLGVSQERVPEKVMVWVAEHGPTANLDDVRLAVLALDRVAGENSEAAQLWAESSLYIDWYRVHEVLRCSLETSKPMTE